MPETGPVTHRGSCHCGDIRFEVDAPLEIEVFECNCSICRRAGFLHLIVAADEFRLLAGEECLTSYRFNTGAANHLFCKTCGIKAFYVPRSHPDGVSVNARCLDPGTTATINIKAFDGANWEQSIEEIRSS
jgi:hypothetical protein